MSLCIKLYQEIIFSLIDEEDIGIILLLDKNYTSC